MKINKDKNDYSDLAIKEHRKFPVKNTAIITVCVVVQIILILFAVTAKAEPKDIIEKYKITVEPLEDGSLDIEYDLTWKAMDSSEELIRVKIGLANSAFELYEDSFSGTIKDCVEIYNEGYTGVRIDFQKGYIDGQSLNFFFKVNQKNMLCRDSDGYFYEFVPCWFNDIPVENYEFRWKKTDTCIEADGAKLKNGYYTWSGSLDCGEYEIMQVSYGLEAFTDAEVVEYEAFYGNGAYNQLKEDRIVKIVALCVGILILLVVEIYLLDSHISYGRGRGFLVGYGHPVHTYGYRNPRYIRAYNAHNASTSTRGSGGFRGGGCACACACAGGGRAGCSQKDTYTNIKRLNK